MQVTDRGLRYLTSLPIKKLLLNGTAVTDTGLAQLKKLTSLHTLILEDTAVRGTGLHHLAALPITQLNLRATEIDDAGLAGLSNWLALSALDLSETAITDAGLMQLANLPHLKRIFAHKTKITAKGSMKLKKSGPDGLVILQ